MDQINHKEREHALLSASGATRWMACAPSALLEDNFYNLQEQYSALEDVDMADAITSFVWAQYCYNAALKAGNSVLSESLMDYLN